MRCLKKRQHALETRKTRGTVLPAKLASLSTSHGTLATAIDAVSKYKKREAYALEQEVIRASDPLDTLASTLQDVSDEVLDWLLSNYLLDYFGNKYLKHHFDFPFSPRFHGVMFPMLRAVECHYTTKPTIMAGWRECGKTACGMTLMPVHSVCHPYIITYPDGTERNLSKEYFIFMSLVRDKAIKILNTFAEELTGNETIRRDYGEFYTKGSWNKTSFLTSRGHYAEAISRYGSGRGLKFREKRPHFFGLDDLDDPLKAKYSRTRRQNDIEHFAKEIQPAIDSQRGNILMMGNMPNELCLTAQLVRYGEQHGWNTKIFRVYEEDASGKKVYTFPEKFGPEFETQKRTELVLSSAFDEEYQQREADGNTEISDDDFKPYDLDYVVNERLRYCELDIATDPALGEKQTADDMAIVPIAFDVPLAKRYALPIFLKKNVGVIGAGDAVVDTYLRWYKLVKAIFMTIETIQEKSLRVMIMEKCRKMGISIPLEPIDSHPSGKALRIKRPYAAIKNGDILFLKHDPLHRIMIQQIRNPDNSEHDDAADAFEMADRMRLERLLKKKPKGSFAVKILDAKRV